MKNYLDSAFWHEDFGFLFDPNHVPVSSTADVNTFRDEGIADLLESSGRLPNLNGAPVASWVLPRLIEVTNYGIHLNERQQQYNDGGCIFLKWVAFTRALKPRAFFTSLFYSNRIVLQGKCTSNTQPSELVSAFIAPLLEQPTALRKWSVSVIDTDPPTAPGRHGRRYVFGWDGAKFLGTREYE